ncbi:hypothetical protein GQ53DRAFT_750534 [Thozetella sp. PMI_491]|nr:hypothetical protein GQ53DRAFT_750534 [Thozetella sp. PMI_491]
MSETIFEENLRWSGGPLFRKPGTTHAEFCESWLNHGQLVLDWFTRLGVVHYFQIHLPDDVPDSLGLPGDGVAALAFAEPRKTETGGKDAFYEEYVLPDERRFLHDESGSRPIPRDPPAFVVPQKAALEWRDMALKAGAKEYRFIENGKIVMDIPNAGPSQ